MSSSKTIRQHFNLLANNYDRYKKNNNLYYLTLIKAVAIEIDNPHSSICDIGCGTGTILNYLNPKKGVGIDISSKMIKIAKKKYAECKNLSFYISNIEEQPIKGKFDYLLFTDVIEHTVNKEKVIRNISLSMTNKSTLILSMANPFWEPILMLLEKLNLKMPEGPHYRISEKDLVDLFKKNNLYVESKNVYLPKLPIFTYLGLIYVYTVKKKI